MLQFFTRIQRSNKSATKAFPPFKPGCFGHFKPLLRLSETSLLTSSTDYFFPTDCIGFFPSSFKSGNWDNYSQYYSVDQNFYLHLWVILATPMGPQCSSLSSNKCGYCQPPALSPRLRMPSQMQEGPAQEAPEVHVWLWKPVPRYSSVAYI